jgi:undecaprenyl-diphosphatase
MDAVSELPSSNAPAQPSGPAWKLPWLTPARCRLTFAALMVFGFLGHLRYLQHNCPIDLSGDEAQYWDWSRALDWSYYSKGPLVAYIIRASCAVFGDVMWAVRLPALLFAVATSVLTYWLTLRLFKSDRLALGVVVLTHLVPMFVAGSLLMTIDPPYFFCWGLASAFLALAVLEGKRWAWPGVGVAVGIGTLAKYGMLIWPLGMFCFLLIDPSSRQWLRTPWPWLAVIIALLFLAPPIVWNVKHDWVTFKHVARQTGATPQNHVFNGNFWEFVGSQVGVLGPPMVVILVAAIVYAFRRQRALQQAPTQDRAVVLLLWMGLPLFVICLLGSLRSKMQVNWPAGAYFSWMILAGYFLSTRLADRQSWKRWRGWVWGAAVLGILMMPVAHNFEYLYRLLPLINSIKKKPVEPRDIDLTVAKMKGWKELGARLTREMRGLNDPFILCEDYSQTAETAFYVDKQPKTFCVGPYITKLSDRKRRTQYDVWADRNLAQPALRGRDALYVGYMNDDVLQSFASVEELPEEPIYRAGYKVRRFKIFRCRDFKGLELKEAGGGF